MNDFGCESYSDGSEFVDGDRSLESVGIESVSESPRDPLDIRWYTYGDESCSNPTDPVTTIFWRGATIGRVRNHVHRHTAMGATFFDGSPQYFFRNGACSSHDESSADASFVKTRYHIRSEQLPVVHRNWGYVSIGTPHFEDIQICKHAVRETTATGSGFDWGRSYMIDQMVRSWDTRPWGGELARPHSWRVIYAGNTARMEQCDTQYAWSNGNVAWIRILPHPNH
jgi:hypothetical protein